MTLEPLGWVALDCQRLGDAVADVVALNPDLPSAKIVDLSEVPDVIACDFPMTPHQPHLLPRREGGMPQGELDLDPVQHDRPGVHELGLIPTCCHGKQWEWRSLHLVW
ncbi:hypothetical protein D3C87_1373310 [compost metagenome]